MWVSRGINLLVGSRKTNATPPSHYLNQVEVKEKRKFSPIVQRCSDHVLDVTHKRACARREMFRNLKDRDDGRCYSSKLTNAVNSKLRCIYFISSLTLAIHPTVTPPIVTAGRMAAKVPTCMKHSAMWGTSGCSRTGSSPELGARNDGVWREET